MLNSMDLAWSVLCRHLRDEEGQTLGEYSILIGFIAIVVVAAAIVVGTTVLGLFNQAIAAF